MDDEIKNVDEDIAFIIELVGGIFGILGIGYMYAGLVKEGIIRLILWILVLMFGWMIAGILSICLIGLCLMPFLLIAQIGIPIWSAYTIRERIKEAFPSENEKK